MRSSTLFFQARLTSVICGWTSVVVSSAAAEAVGVKGLSLGELPTDERLFLRFSEVTDSGFGFKTMRGDGSGLEKLKLFLL